MKPKPEMTNKESLRASILTKTFHQEQLLYWQRFLAFSALHAALLVAAMSKAIAETTVLTFKLLGVVLALMWLYVQWRAYGYANRDKKAYNKLLVQIGIRPPNFRSSTRWPPSSTLVGLLVPLGMVLTWIYLLYSNVKLAHLPFLDRGQELIKRMTTMSNSDWILIGTSLFLGFCALIVPRIAEAVKRKAYAPELSILYRHEPPYAHPTVWRSRQILDLCEPVHFFRLRVENKGKSQARHCEMTLEALWRYDNMDRPEKIENFTAVSLRYDESGNRFIDLNPKRKMYWALGHISSPAYQKNHELSKCIDMPGNFNAQLRLVFDQIDVPFSQPNCLPKGKYAVKILVTSENAKAQEEFYEIIWSGIWKDASSEMLGECFIRRIDDPARQ